MEAVESPKICTLIGSVCPKHINILMKKYRSVISYDTDAKFEEKLTLGSKNDMRNLVNSIASSGKSGNMPFDVLLLPIAHKVSA